MLRKGPIGQRNAAARNAIIGRAARNPKSALEPSDGYPDSPDAAGIHQSGVGTEPSRVAASPSSAWYSNVGSWSAVRNID